MRIFTVEGRCDESNANARRSGRVAPGTQSGLDDESEALILACPAFPVAALAWHKPGQTRDSK
jgi:hypothetical protein